MLFNIILFVSMYPVIFIMYFVLKYSGNNRNGTVFGLCVPKDKTLAAEFEQQVRQKQSWYRKRMRTTLIVLLFLPLVSFAFPYISIQFTIWMLWLIAGIVFLELPCIRVNRELKVWKKMAQAKMRAEEASAGISAADKEAGEPARRAAVTDAKDVREGGVRLFELSEAGQVRKTKLFPFLIPTLLSGAAVVLYRLLYQEPRARQMTWIILLFALCTPMFYMAAGWMDRQRTAVVSYDSEVNLNYARAKKQIWNRLWLLCAWLNTIFTIFGALVLGNERITVLWLLWGTIGYIALTMLCILFAVRKVNRLEERYEKKIDPRLKEEDDDCWLWGMLYYNKADKRTLVETRVGYGTATNVATPLGKGLMAVAVLSILSLPVVCVWMILLEFTPIRLDVKENRLVAEQLKTDYQINVTDIAELELVEELPELSKNAGTGMDNLYKGNWHILYAGDCEVFLNPKNSLFLKFTADGELYYMSVENDVRTKEVYEELKVREEGKK